MIARCAVRPGSRLGFHYFCIASADGPVMHYCIPGDDTDHFTLALPPAQRSAQIHQTPAFGVGGKPVFDGLIDALTHGKICLESFHLCFGKAPANQQAINVLWKGLIVKGVEGYQFRPSGLQLLQIVRVVKAKGGILSDSDADLG